MKKQAEITFSDITEYEVIAHVHTAETRLSVKHNDETTIYGNIYSGNRQELESFISSLEALPELIDSIEYWLALDRTKAEGNEEVKRIHELAKEKFCKVMELVYNGK